MIKSFSFIWVALLVSSCGGGGSSSSGASVAPPAPIIVVPNGLFDGMRTYSISNSVGELESGTTRIQLIVSGAPGAQQVRLAFREFSGSSSVGPNQEFSIPSGPFPSGGCTISTVFAGRFVDSTVSGTEIGTITCPNVGQPLSLTGDFQATLTASKLGGLEPSYRAE